MKIAFNEVKMTNDKNEKDGRGENLCRVRWCIHALKSGGIAFLYVPYSLY